MVTELFLNIDDALVQRVLGIILVIVLFLDLGENGLVFGDFLLPFTQPALELFPVGVFFLYQRLFALMHLHHVAVKHLNFIVGGDANFLQIGQHLDIVHLEVAQVTHSVGLWI